MNAYFWVLIGVLYRLPQLTRPALPESSRAAGPTSQFFATSQGGH